jgi:aryl-alcohol dehydrogenase-like predicted oxidoreductase
MPNRTLGQSNLEVSSLGFGCMGISFGYGRVSSREDGIGIIRAALEELGIGFVPFSPLGKGFRKANLAFVGWLKTFAAGKKATPAHPKGQGSGRGRTKPLTLAIPRNCCTLDQLS